MIRMRRKPHLVRADVVDAIAFYQARGWDWSGVVAFLAQRALWHQVKR